MKTTGHNASQQEAQGEEGTPCRAARPVARRLVWLAVLCGLLLLALVVEPVRAHPTTNDITSSNASPQSQVTPSTVTHTTESSETNVGPTEHPSDDSPRVPNNSKESDTSLRMTERLDIAGTNHRVTRSVENPCKSDDDTLREWYKQNKVTETREASKSICAPKPQYIYENAHNDSFEGRGVIVNRCPSGCGMCAYASHRCRSNEAIKVKKLAQFKDSDGNPCYRKVEVEEHTKCECIYEGDGDNADKCVHEEMR